MVGVGEGLAQYSVSDRVASKLMHSTDSTNLHMQRVLIVLHCLY